jgi:hypothetical protein
MYVLLANAYRNLDRENDAEATRQKGERLFPDDESFARANAAALAH